MFSLYWAEFLPLMLVFLLAVISPGADFALILRQALIHDRRAAILASFGIGSAILVHVGYTILGLGIIIAQSPLLFTLIKWAGIVYLLYLGVQALTSKTGFSLAFHEQAHFSQKSLKSFTVGFAINLLNPKAVLFFLSIYSNIVAVTTPLMIKFSYGVIIAMIAIAWFVLVSVFMTTPAIRQSFIRFSKWINRVSGLIFIGLGLRLIFYES